MSTKIEEVSMKNFVQEIKLAVSYARFGWATKGSKEEKRFQELNYEENQKRTRILKSIGKARKDINTITRDLGDVSRQYVAACLFRMFKHGYVRRTNAIPYIYWRI